MNYNPYYITALALLIVVLLGVALYGLFGPRKQKPPQRRPFQNGDKRL